MRVILLQELKGRGGEGDVIEVARGFAVNYLFRNKIAIEATKGNLKQLELRKHNIAKREANRLDTADKVVAALNEQRVIIGARVGEEGQLFGSVTSQQIAEAISEHFGLDVDRKRIDLRVPIKTAGVHEVTIAIYREVKAVLTVEVVDEQTLNAEAEPEAAELGINLDQDVETPEPPAAEALPADEVAEAVVADAAEETTEPESDPDPEQPVESEEPEDTEDTEDTES